jgi:SMODS and SLOG-associating 2TM effector domain 1
MTERTQQYLSLYRQYRYEDQRAFYESREKEFEAAADEVIWLTAVLMVFTAGAAALAAADIGRLHVLWSILAVTFPALSTALSAYNGLYAFERQAKLYGDAANALLRARADSPDLKPAMDDTAFAAAVSAHVQQVEQILSGEQAQWGQLIGEIKPVAPPESKSVPEKPPLQ